MTIREKLQLNNVFLDFLHIALIIQCAKCITKWKFLIVIFQSFQLFSVWLGFLRNLKSSFPADSLSQWKLQPSIFPCYSFCSFLPVGKNVISPYSSSPAPSFSLSYRWAVGFTKRAHWLRPPRPRRHQRAATDASWATSLTAPCSGSLSASPPNSSKQPRLRPVSTSPSEHNCLFLRGATACAVLSWHWEVTRELKQNDQPF